MNTNEHLLTIAIEECAEVQKEICKGLRFGLDDRDPNDPELENAWRIVNEWHQLEAIMKTLFDRGILPKHHAENREAIMEKKLARILTYMNYARGRKTLT